MKRWAVVVVVMSCGLGGCADDEGEPRLRERQNDQLADPFGYGPTLDGVAEREKQRPRRRIDEDDTGLNDLLGDPGTTPEPADANESNAE